MIILTITTDGPAFRPLLFTGRFILGIGVGWTSVSGGVSSWKILCMLHVCVCVLKRAVVPSTYCYITNHSDFI